MSVTKQLMDPIDFHSIFSFLWSHQLSILSTWSKFCWKTCYTQSSTCHQLSDW